MRLLVACLMLAACSAPRPAPVPDVTAALEQRVDALVAPYPDALVAVSVRDAHTGTTWHRNGDSLVHAASTMKVPVMIELFRQAEAGRFSLDDEVTVKNTFTSILDGSPYAIETDSDQQTYDQIGQKLTIRELIERMTVVSSNLATNLLIEHVTADSVQATIERLGARRMRVYRGVEDIPAYRAGLNNTATAADLSLLMQALGEGRAVSPRADAEMVEVLLRQRYNEMIPAGIPVAQVAHKTGWITGIRHDAALVVPPDAPSYALVVLTRGFEDPATADTLGAAIAREVHALLRPAR
jgi:beta-lactamase class A